MATPVEQAVSWIGTQVAAMTARNRLTVVAPISPRTAEMLEYASAGSTPEMTALDFLSRWVRRRNDPGQLEGAIAHINRSTLVLPPAPEDSPPLELSLDPSIHDQIKRARPPEWTIEQYTAYLLDRWAEWHLVSRRAAHRRSGGAQ